MREPKVNEAAEGEIGGGVGGEEGLHGSGTGVVSQRKPLFNGAAIVCDASA